jgi:hypothetical protein
VIDVVNGILDVFEQTKDATPLNFGDGSWVDNKYGNPPVAKNRTKIDSETHL